MPNKMIADPRLREDDEKGCGVFKGRSPFGEGVMEDLAWKGDNRPRLQSGGGFPRLCLQSISFMRNKYFDLWRDLVIFRA